MERVAVVLTPKSVGLLFIPNPNATRFFVGHPFCALFRHGLATTWHQTKGARGEWGVCGKCRQWVRNLESHTVTFLSKNLPVCF